MTGTSEFGGTGENPPVEQFSCGTNHAGTNNMPQAVALQQNLRRTSRMLDLERRARGQDRDGSCGRPLKSCGCSNRDGSENADRRMAAVRYE